MGNINEKKQQEVNGNIASPKSDANRQQQQAGKNLNSPGQSQQWSQDQKADKGNQKFSNQTDTESETLGTTREFEPDGNETDVVNPTMLNRENKQKINQYDRQDRA